MRNAIRAPSPRQAGLFSFPSISRCAFGPPSPSITFSFPSNRPPCSVAAPTPTATNRFHSAGERSGRSPATTPQVLRGHQPARVEPASSARDIRAQSSRSPSTVARSMRLRPAACSCCPAPKLDQVEASGASQQYTASAFRSRFVEVSPQNKKCGEPPPHSARGTQPAQHLQGIERWGGSSEARGESELVDVTWALWRREDHGYLRPHPRAMREEARVVMARAPGEMLVAARPARARARR